MGEQAERIKVEGKLCGATSTTGGRKVTGVTRRKGAPPTMAESSSSATEAAKGKLQKLQLHHAHTLTIPNKKVTCSTHLSTWPGP